MSHEGAGLTIVRGGSPPTLIVRVPHAPVGGVTVRSAPRSWPRRGAPSQRTVVLDFEKDAGAGADDKAYSASLVLTSDDLGGSQGIQRWRSRALEVKSASGTLLHSTTLVPFWQTAFAFVFVLFAMFVLVQGWLELRDTGPFVVAAELAGSSVIAYVAAQLFGGAKPADMISPAIFKRVRVAGLSALLVAGIVLGVPRLLWTKIDNQTGVDLSDGSAAKISARSTKVVAHGAWSRIWTAVQDKRGPDVEKADPLVASQFLPLLPETVVRCRSIPTAPEGWLMGGCGRPQAGLCPLAAQDDACALAWKNVVAVDVGNAAGRAPRAGATWARLEVPPARLEVIVNDLKASRAPTVRIGLRQASIPFAQGEPASGSWRAGTGEVVPLASVDRVLRVEVPAGEGQGAATSDLRCAPGGALRVEAVVLARELSGARAVTLQTGDGREWAAWRRVSGPGAPALCTPEETPLPEGLTVIVEQAAVDKARLRVVRRDGVLRVDVAPRVRRPCYVGAHGQPCKGRPGADWNCQQVFEDVPADCSALWSRCDCRE
jgi:hypothetical protein